MSLRLVLTAHQNVISLSRITTFSLEKEAYTAYSTLKVTAYGTFSASVCADIYRVALYDEETCLHYGTIETLSFTRENGVMCLELTSRGLTAMLLQNQLEPGIHASLSLDSLMRSFYTFPEGITWEDSEKVNYLYVKQNSGMWDGVVALCYKCCARYPLICGANEVRFTLPETYTFYVADEGNILRTGVATDQSLVTSDFYMADVSGVYGAYHEGDDEAITRDILRTKQLALDQQYLYSPQDALTYRRKFADRRLVRYFIEVNGAVAVSLGDHFRDGSVVEDGVITRVRMVGDRRGIRTRLETYADGFYTPTLY